MVPQGTLAERIRAARQAWEACTCLRVWAPS